MSCNHVFNISLQLMTSSRMQDRVDSNDESKGKGKIISECRKNSRSRISAVQRELTFKIHTDADVSNISTACFIVQSVQFYVHFHISWLSAHTLNELYCMPISHTRA